MSASKNREVSTLQITDQEVSLSSNLTGQFSTIADIQVPNGMRYEFPAGMGIECFIYTHESATVTTDSGTETVSLSNDLVNSPAVSDIPTSASNTASNGMYSLVVWDDESDIQTGVNSVDYDANSFDYTTPSATDRDLEVYYLWKDPSQLEFRTEPRSEESFDIEKSLSVRNFHEASVFNQNAAVTFSQPFTLDEKEHLKLTVKTDVDLTNWDTLPGDGSSPGTVDTYGYSDFSIPVRKVPKKR